MSHSQTTIEHPVLELFEKYAPELKEFVAGYQAAEALDRSAYTREHYGFFADAVEEAVRDVIGKVDDFSFTPLEVIAIFSKVDELNLPGIQTAQVIASAYASAPLKDPAWRRFPRYFLENETYPEKVLRNATELAIYEERLQSIEGVVNFYTDIASTLTAGRTSLLLDLPD